MGTLTNITATTPGDMLFRAGSLTVNAVNIGALEGDVTVRFKKDDHIPELAGAAGEVTGTRFRMGLDVTVAFQVAVWQLATLARAIAGMYVSSNASSEVLGSSEDVSDTVGCISSTEYVTCVFTVQQCDGKNSVFTLYNAIADGDVELKFADKGHLVYAITMKGTYSPVDPDMSPWVWVHNTA